ncbi:MAG TPA: Clp protease N-terminal domain-containing protein [Acidimicrobiales bacterium]|nr:Clp protease N-terminal domain-containing protein [Acidimicrobiales bacterium]
MFERFTDRARRVLVLAQEQARVLGHSFIGTEHILLGLVEEGDGLAAQVLLSFDVRPDAVRTLIVETVGAGDKLAAETGSPPFTPRAKKALEMSLREALQLGHNYIGTEHMLLGVMSDGEGVAARVLVGLGLDLDSVRARVVELLGGFTPPPEEAAFPRLGRLGRGAVAAGQFTAGSVKISKTADGSVEVEVVESGRHLAAVSSAFETLTSVLDANGVALDELDADSIWLMSVRTDQGPGTCVRARRKGEPFANPA